MLKIVCALMTSFLLNSCGEVANKSRLSVVVGTNDLSYYLEDDRISNSIGHIALGCTATHIGDGLVITAGHCITDLTCEDEKYDITWNFRSNNFDGQLVSKCAKIVVSENHFNGDYAVLRYETYPEQSLKIDLDQQLQYGDKLTIFLTPTTEPYLGQSGVNMKAFLKTRHTECPTLVIRSLGQVELLC